MKKIKVLITSIGSVNGINILKALENQRCYEIDIVSVDADELAAGFFLKPKQKTYAVSKASGRQYIRELIKICQKEKVKILFPSLSAELMVISRYKRMFEKAGVKMLISDFKTFMNTWDKVKAQRMMEEWGVPCPKIYQDLNVKFPAIVKPIASSGTRNVFRVDNEKELLFFKDYVKNSFVQEFIEGQEYTIDGISDKHGKAVDCISRKRLMAKYGLAWQSEIDYDAELMGWAKMIAEGFKIIGPWNIQCIKNKKGIFFTDVNARFPSGGLPLDVYVGFNVPIIVIQMILGDKLFRIKHHYAHKLYKRTYSMRYFDVVFAAKNPDNSLTGVEHDWREE